MPEEEFGEKVEYRALPEPIKIKQEILDIYFRAARAFGVWLHPSGSGESKLSFDQIQQNIFILYFELKSKLDKKEQKELTELKGIIEKQLEKDPMLELKTPTRHMKIYYQAYLTLQRAMERIGILRIERRYFEEGESMA